MRFRFPSLAAGSAAVVCAIAQAHPVSLKSACDEHDHFIPAHEVVLKPSVLQQPYQEFLASHNVAQCGASNKGNPAPTSCGGVNHTAFARHTAQQICGQESDIVGIRLKYNIEMTTTPIASMQPRQTTSNYFPYTLRISCGVCGMIDIPAS